jgi:hypothetical protein
MKKKSESEYEFGYRQPPPLDCVADVIKNDHLPMFNKPRITIKHKMKPPKPTVSSKLRKQTSAI